MDIFRVKRGISTTGIILFFALVVPAFATNCASAAEKLFVKSIRADIFSAPSLGAEKILSLERGAELGELSRNGGWSEVRSAETTGWVPRLLVGPRPPSGDLSPLDVENRDLGKDARRRASALTSAAGARGLREGRGRLSDNHRADYAALEKMEAFFVGDAEALMFLKKGGEQ